MQKRIATCPVCNKSLPEPRHTVVNIETCPKCSNDKTYYRLKKGITKEKYYDAKEKRTRTHTVRYYQCPKCNVKWLPSQVRIRQKVICPLRKS